MCLWFYIFGTLIIWDASLQSFRLLSIFYADVAVFISITERGDLHGPNDINAVVSVVYGGVMSAVDAYYGLGDPITMFLL